MSTSPSTPPVVLEDRSHLFLHRPRPAVRMVRGAGSWLWDAGGRAYLDFTQGWAVNALGHAPAVVVDALATQAATLLNAGPAFFSDPQLELAERLTALSGLPEVFLCSIGAEANEGAVKLARKWGRVRRKGAATVITASGSFHGRTLAMTSASGKPGWESLFPPATPGFVKVPYGDVDAVARAIDEHTAAVMVEPIQGEGGVVVPPAGYLAGLRTLTRARGVLFIVDEVQTGIGRTGTAFAFEAEGARPDILTLGKGLGAGVPLAAVLATHDAAAFDPGDQGGTHAGNTTMAAVGVAVLRTLTAPGFLDAVRARAAELAAALQALAAPRGGGVRGRGLLQALVLATPQADAVVAAAREEGLLLNAPRPDVLRVSPALTVTADEVQIFAGRLAAALARAGA